MKKIRAILVDDEPRARNVLANLLARNCPEVELIASCENVLEAVDQIKELKPDLVFLDIQMPEYNGYELMKFLPHIQFDIIFVTAYDQYALKAFELNAVDYLLKPVKRERLKTSVKKVAKKLKINNAYVQYEELVKSLNEKKHTQIVVKSTEGRNVIKFSNLVGIEGQGAYSTIYLSNGITIFTSKNLKYFQDLLEIDERFCRCHKSWIVNLDLIVSADKQNLALIMSTNIEIKVSKSKRADLGKLLEER